MTVNSLYPAFVRFYYAVSGRQHVHQVPVGFSPGSVTPGADPTTVALISPGGAVTFDDFCATYVAWIAALYNTAATSFSRAELWEVASPGADPTFVSVEYLGTTGSSASAVNPYSQLTISFRTSAGGILKIVLLDQVQAANVRDDFPVANVAVGAIASYILSTASPIIGRDNGRPVAGIRFLTKTNDVIRKRNLLDQ